MATNDGKERTVEEVVEETVDKGVGKGKSKKQMAAVRNAQNAATGNNVPPIEVNETYTTQDGKEIKLKWVNPLLIQAAQRSVKIPDPPIQEIKTHSGRIEEWPVDQETALEVWSPEENPERAGMYKDPQLAARWNHYIKREEEASAEQTQRVMSVVFGEGTEFTPPEDEDWVARDEAYGITVPPKSSKLARKIHYLVYHLPGPDINGLMTAIMTLTGVPEEVIQEAEASFRGNIPAKSQ